MESAQIIFSIIWGAFGMGYFVYGKKQQKFVPLLCGIGLMVFPYFVENWIGLLLIGLVFTILPFVIR